MWGLLKMTGDFHLIFRNLFFPLDESRWSLSGQYLFHFASELRMNAISFGLWFSMNCGHLLFLSPVTRLIIGLSAGLASKNWARIKAAFIPLRSTSFVCFVWDQVAVDLVILKKLINEFLRTQRSRLCFHSYANVYKCCRCFLYICYFEWLMNLQ